MGYITTENGIIFKTIDGGNTWKQNGNGSFYTMRTISFAPDSSVYVAGQYGSILRSDVREHRIDSFKVNTYNNCTTDFSSVITAVLSSVDSIKFEYGINSFDREVAASPSVINNKQQQVAGSVTNLFPSTQYKVRLKVYYQGQYYYSNEYSFRISDRPSTPAITASGNTTFCQGDSIHLTSSATTGNDWFLNGARINGATSQTYTASQSGKYQVIRTIGCYSSDTTSINVTVTPVPARPSISVAGNILSSSASIGNRWYVNGTEIPNGTSQQYTADANGLYTVRVTASDCASPFSNTLDFVVLGSNIIMYPNPVTNELVVRSTVGERMSIQLMNGAGNIIYSAESSSSSHTINMSHLAPGNYFVRVKFLGNNETSVKMVVKQ